MPLASRPSRGPAVGDQRHELVAVGDRAGLVDDQHPVGVAVEADAEVGAVGDTAAAAASGWVEPQSLLMLKPSGRDRDRDDLGAELPQHLGRGAVGGAVGAVDDDLEAVEALALGEGGLGELHVAAAGVVDAGGPADGARLGEGGRGLEQRLDLLLDGVGELEAVGAEELDAVVLEGVVRGRDHHPEVGAHRARQHADRRRRHRADEEDVHADRGEAGDQRGLQHVARAAGVLADQHAVGVGPRW